MKTTFATKISRIANEHCLTQKIVKRVIYSFLKNLRKELIEEGEVSINHYFAIKSKQMNAKLGRNPKTGEVLNIPAYKKVIIRVGKFFKSIQN